jgi:superfamily II DNA/RNA helicase
MPATGVQLLTASASSSGGAAVVGVQFLMAAAVLTDQHNTALRREFFEVVWVTQTSSSLGVLVPTLRQEFHYFSGGTEAKDAKLVRLLTKAACDPWMAMGSTLVFCTEQADVNRLVAVINNGVESGLAASFCVGALHAGLDSEARAAAIAILLQAAGRLLVCTDVAVSAKALIRNHVARWPTSAQFHHVNVGLQS